MLKTKSNALIFCLLLLVSTFSIPAIMPARGQEELFHVTLMVPQPNPARQAWSLIIQSNLKTIGIDAGRVVLDWGTIYDRALEPPVDVVGKTYDEGGFDMLFVGYALTMDPDPFAIFDSSQFSPTGQNYYLWNDSENDRLGQLIKETVDETTRLGYVGEWQLLAHEEVPVATLLYTEEVVGFDPTALLEGPFTRFNYPCWPEVERWELNASTTQTKFVVAQTGPCPEQGLTPWLTTSYYDLTAWVEVFDGLTERNSTASTLHVPALAESWEVAADDKTWTVNLRQGVTWHDGVKFNATDVKFTYEAAMSPELASPVGAFVEAIIGSVDNIEIVDEYTVRFHLPEVYAYFPTFLNNEEGYSMILPWHVLKDVPYADWRTHTFNTGEGSYDVDTPSGTYTAYGPIGNGPYVYMGYDPLTFTNHMVRYDNYWANDTLWDAGLFQVEEYFVQWIEGSDAAIAALKAGDVDVLDSQYHLETKLGSIEAPWGDYVSYEAFGVQELGFNMEHPVLGTGVDTPLGQEDPTRAAEAAKYVRQAISNLIPRQDIIDVLLNGFGTPGRTNVICTLTAGYDPTIVPYAFNTTGARELLELAGYFPPAEEPEPGFWEQYGLYIAIVLVVIIIAMGALYVVRTRKPT
ncbi:MAG: ABC transporter substrate-binding protein [Candidatus Bathyarchaeota archaeon]|nr:ABC transporter substrate-binding protein [Candidatus Bathyarchaeota archaeon]MDH5779903.1 ABC transporter substrate-binding protein [Candidatus Bathyarchaeota archaeon]